MTQRESSKQPFRPSPEDAVVRYLVADAQRSVRFYTEQLGFQAEANMGATFAVVRRGRLLLLLGGPESSGARPLSDGSSQAPGGSNRIVLFVEDLDKEIRRLQPAGVKFRNQVEKGPGGSQIQLEDPDGNPIELHEPARPSA